MKLKQLSLCILVACGLAACGGSNSNDNAPTDPGAGTPPPPPPKPTETKPTVENNGLEVPVDPTRAAPTMSIEKNLTDSVKVAKQFYIDRQTRDAIAGYNGWLHKKYTVDPKDKNKTVLADETIDQNIFDDGKGLGGELDGTFWNDRVTNAGITFTVPENNQGGFSYNPGSTDKADILRASSIYNYYAEQSKEGSLNDKGGIHPNPAFSYAQGTDGKYYRVVPANGAKWDDLDANSKFTTVVGSNVSGLKTVSQKDLVFIPNALALTEVTTNTDDAGKLGTKNTNALGAHLPATSEFKAPSPGIIQNEAGINALDPNSIAYFNVNRGSVQYKSFNLAGKRYDLIKDFNASNIDLGLDDSVISVQKGIQELPITLDYDVINNQATGALKDDEVVHRTAKVGELKVYNLPYSRSLISINQTAVDKPGDLMAAPNNFFGFADTSTDGHFGAFQVVGFPTTALPKDGRTDYTGQSYGVDSVGDVHLRADFGVERPHIWGTVDNRQKLSDKTVLPNLVLKEISFRSSNYYGGDQLNVASHGMDSNSTSNDGAVTIGGRGVGKWAVGLFGPNAEEAAGVIDLNPGVTNGRTFINGPDKGTQGKKFEVFSTQRGSIIKDSLNPGVGVVGK